MTWAPLAAAGIGAAGSLLSSLLGRKAQPAQYGQQAAITPEQTNILNQLLSQIPLGQGLETITGQLTGRSPIEGDIMRQYQQELIPQLAEQFAGTGAMGSSGFQQQMAGGAERLASMLGAQRTGLQQTGILNLLNLLTRGLGTQAIFPTYQQAQPSIAQTLAPLFGQLTGAGLGQFGAQQWQQTQQRNLLEQQQQAHEQDLARIRALSAGKP